MRDTPPQRSPLTRLTAMLDERAHRATALLLAIAIVAVSMCAFWALRVPFLQGTDEQAHADYAYALFDAGRWFVVRGAVPADHATEQVRYLQRTSNFWALRFYRDARVPRGYDAENYFSKVDRLAPEQSNRAPTSGMRFPYVAFNYPVGFYLLASAIMREAYRLDHGSLSATYFAARGLGVAMLLVALVFSYGTLRQLRYQRATSLALTAVVGLLPLASWVCGYIQPDTMIFALVSASLFFTLNLKQKPFSNTPLASLSTTLTLAILVKQHYGIILTVACALTTCSTLLVRRASRSRMVVVVAATVLIPIVAFVVATSITPIGHLGLPADLTRYQRVGPPGTRIASLLTSGFYGVVDLYAGGNAFRSFWFEFGDLLTAEIGPPRLLFTFEIIVAVLSINVFVFIIIRQYHVYLRLIAVASTHWRSAVSLFCGDIMLTVYFFWLALLLAVLSLSNGNIYLEGRYFLPVILPTILLTVRALPRLAPRSLRVRCSKAFVVAWLAFAAVMSPAAAITMNLRFYGPGGVEKDHTGDAVVIVQSMRTGHVTVRNLRSITTPRAEILWLTVYVASQRPLSQVSGLTCSLDGGLMRNVVSAKDVSSFDGLTFHRYLVRIRDFAHPGLALIHLTGYVNGRPSGYEEVHVIVSPSISLGARKIGNRLAADR